MKLCSAKSGSWERNGSSVCRIPSVCSLEKVSVEKVKTTAAHTATKSHARKRENPSLFHLIVGCLAGDDDVVNVAFAEPGGSDAHKPAVLLQLAKIGGAAISHSAAQAAGKLIDEAAERPFVGHAPLHALGHGLSAVRCLLRVTVRRPGFHGAERTHAPVRLEGAPLIENGFAGRLFGAGKEAPDHDHGGAGGNGLGDISRIFHPAVGDHGNTRAFRGPRGFHDGGYLRHSGAGDDARRADGPRTDADFEAIDAESDEVARAFVRADISRHQLHTRQALSYRANRFHDARGMAV